VRERLAAKRQQQWPLSPLSPKEVATFMKLLAKMA
jgi:hypothetical protein